MIDLSEVLLNTGVKKAYQVDLNMDIFSYKMGDYPIVQKEPVLLEIISPSNNKVCVAGTLHIHLGIPCGRCLETVDYEINVPIERELYIGEDLPEDAERQDFVTERKLDTEAFLFQEILMNLPMNVLCKTDCKGICKKCGRNLNLGDCGCDNFVPDPRMSAIQDIFRNFGKTTD